MVTVPPLLMFLLEAKPSTPRLRFLSCSGPALGAVPAGGGPEGGGPIGGGPMASGLSWELSTAASSMAESEPGLPGPAASGSGSMLGLMPGVGIGPPGPAGPSASGGKPGGKPKLGGMPGGRSSGGGNPSGPSGPIIGPCIIGAIPEPGGPAGPCIARPPSTNSGGGSPGGGNPGGGPIAMSGGGPGGGALNLTSDKKPLRPSGPDKGPISGSDGGPSMPRGPGRGPRSGSGGGPSIGPRKSGMSGSGGGINIESPLPSGRSSKASGPSGGTICKINSPATSSTRWAEEAGRAH
mmetsp:Transcript_132707/g.216075  ORF Transcript_132707/g.216075 Transcript_132707/m.216075 type:complete len:294 (+) Transcript_132707:543-1424(+)